MTMIVHDVKVGKRTTVRDLHGKRKSIYVGCAKRDVRHRDMLINFKHRWAFYTKSEFGFRVFDWHGFQTDLWKPIIRDIIRETDGVMMLVSGHTKSDPVAVWEIDNALADTIPIVGVDIRKNAVDTIPEKLEGKMTRYGWEWFSEFIDSL